MCHSFCFGMNESPVHSDSNIHRWGLPCLLFRVQFFWEALQLTEVNHTWSNWSCCTTFVMMLCLFESSGYMWGWREVFSVVHAQKFKREDAHHALTTEELWDVFFFHPKVHNTTASFIFFCPWSWYMGTNKKQLCFSQIIHKVKLATKKKERSSKLNVMPMPPNVQTFHFGPQMGTK